MLVDSHYFSLFLPKSEARVNWWKNSLSSAIINFVFIFKPKSEARKILFVAPEAAPFVKAGGLGSVMFALPRALKNLGYDVRLMIPRFASIDLEKFNLTMELEGLQVPTDSQSSLDNEPTHLTCNVRRYKPNDSDSNGCVTTYFLENLEYYEKRSNIYGYNDDAVRWALLSRGTLEFLRVSREWLPDVIVTSDWQTGFLCNYLRTTYKDDPRLRELASVFMIHNLYYQGMFDHKFVSEMDYDDGQSVMPSFFDPRILKINGMRRGIMHADIVSTVSPTYAKEIMTPDYGELLDGLLRERRSRVYGILNGIDYAEFNPKTDRFLIQNYDQSSLDLRARNKLELQSRFGLETDKNKFLVAIASRFSEQKGLDLLFPVMDVIMRELNIQIAVLGSGEGKYMGFFQDLEKRYLGQVGAHLAFDEVMPHLIHGGADAVLIPSKFEPAGLLQLEAMRYGAIPIARKTGGLADTVEDVNPLTVNGTGFVFNNFDSQAMMLAIARAFENYRQKSNWQSIQKRAMSKDFSWDKSAKEYAHLFTLAHAFRKREISKE